MEKETNTLLEHKEKDKYITIKIKTKNISAQSLIILTLVALIFVSGFQTYQLLQIRNANAGSPVIKITTSTPTTTPSADTNSLPDMVGGC